MLEASGFNLGCAFFEEFTRNLWQRKTRIGVGGGERVFIKLYKMH